jgi:4-amino-4-deoxy-L-arabinose transferase-like glycosyltransferase
VSDQQNPQMMDRRWLLAVLVLAFALRAAAAWHWRDELAHDRDGYLAIAANLRDGNGFSSDGRQPTAFRPPLYPLFLAAMTAAGGEWAVAVAQVLLGVGTVWLTYLIGRHLGMARRAIAAAGLVAVDPLLLRYTPQLMTETLFAFLVALLCCWCTGIGDRDAPSVRVAGPGWLKPRHQQAALVGFVFGVCALCRPTIWVFGALGGIGWLIVVRRLRLSLKQAIAESVIAISVCLLLVSPWVVRNIRAFRQPIVMTTHGGYTLLLGNNPVFYDEVVRQPWGTVWDGKSLRQWQASLEVEMQTDDPPPKTELERDRWMRNWALWNIRDDPAGFAAACWLRFRRFWNIAPVADDASFRPAAVRWGLAAFYTLVTIGLLAGLFRLQRMEWRRWWPLAVLLVSFTAVHLVYWTNTRMRAPLIPVVALFCIRAVCRSSQSNANSERGDGVVG